MYKILRDGQFFAEGTNLQMIANLAEEDVSRYSFSEESVKEINNAPIYEKLQEIDLKSIRALRTNDIERLQELELEAQSLRDQLI